MSRDVLFFPKAVETRSYQGIAEHSLDKNGGGIIRGTELHLTICKGMW